MRTIYFLEPNQKLSNVKPSERKRALLLSTGEWNKFGEHLTREKRKLEAAERAAEAMEHRKTLSKEMAKKWDNTIVNLRRRRLEVRRDQVAQLERDRRKRYLEMRQEEADAKKKTVEAAKEILRGGKDNAKSFTSALKFSEVLRERQEQLTFDEELRKIEEGKEREYAESIKRDAEMYAKELKEEKEREREKQEKLCKEAIAELQAVLKEKKKAETKELELEKLDNLGIQKEILIEQENYRKEMERKKKIARDDVLENKKMIAKFKAKCKAEEEEEDAAILIQAAAKKRIAKTRKQKEKESAAEMLARKERISMAVAAEAEEKDTAENERIRIAVAEREAKEEERRTKTKRYYEKLVKDIQEERKAYIQREEESKKKEKELLKWEMMQRFKLTEVNNEFTEKMRQKKDELVKRNRHMWDKQMEEKTAAIAEEKALDVNAVKRAVECWNLEDKQFLEYADKILKESKKKGRPLLPMLRYVEKYKKEVGLTPPPKQHKMWQSQVPIDSKAASKDCA